MAFIKVLTIVALIFAFNCVNVESKVFDKCSLARELVRLGFPKNEMGDWVCLAQYESSYNTRAMNYKNWDGSFDWGLFQINDNYWCNPNRAGFWPKGNGCGVNCDAFLSDDITAAAKCVQLIKRSSWDGFGAWVAWRQSCQGRRFDLSSCNIPGVW